MRKLPVILIVISLFLISSQSYAQNADDLVPGLVKDATQDISIDDTSSTPWRFGGVFHLNFSQSTLSHWAAGGDKSSFSLTGLFNGYAAYRKGKFSWDNLADLAYGYTKTSSTGYRKTDDHLHLTSQLGYQATQNGKWFYSIMADFKTQFANGYLFDDDGHQTLNSTFLSPGYLLVSAGINYKPTDYFNVYLSPVTERWTFVRNDTLSAHGEFGVTPGHHVMNELGAFLSARFNKDFGETFNLTSRLDLFSNYKENPQNIDIYFTNLFSMKVTKYIATTISLIMIYDDDVKFPVEGKPDQEVAHLQIQEVLGVGLSYKF